MQIFSLYKDGPVRTARLTHVASLLLGRTDPEIQGHRPDVAFDDDYRVSRRHAILRKETGRWCLEDQGSKHGTFLEGKNITQQGSQIVRPGNLIQTGDTVWTFVPDDWLCVLHGSVLVCGPCLSVVSAACQQNRWTVVGPLRARNLSSSGSGAFAVGLELAGFSSRENVPVPAQAAMVDTPLEGDFRLLPVALQDLHRPVKAELRVFLDGKELPDHRVLIVLPAMYWSYDSSSRALLAAYVFPRSRAIEDFVCSAQRFLPGGVTFGQLLTSQGPGREQTALRALYEALAERKIAYAAPRLRRSGHDGPRYQEIRRPHVVFNGGQATCLDLALLLAGCLEHLGLCPIVVLLGPDADSPDHAFVGCWKGPTPGPTRTTAGSRLVDQVARRHLLLVESTAAACGFCGAGVVGFEQAAETAHLALKRAAWARGVDIAACRREPDAIAPLGQQESALVQDIHARARKAAEDRGFPQVQIIHLLYALLATRGPATMKYINGNRACIDAVLAEISRRLPTGHHDGKPERTRTYLASIAEAGHRAEMLRSDFVEEEHLLWAVLGKGYESGLFQEPSLGQVMWNNGWVIPPQGWSDNQSARMELPPPEGPGA